MLNEIVWVHVTSSAFSFLKIKIKKNIKDQFKTGIYLLNVSYDVMLSTANQIFTVTYILN